MKNHAVQKHCNPAIILILSAVTICLCACTQTAPSSSFSSSSSYSSVQTPQPTPTLPPTPTPRPTYTVDELNLEAPNSYFLDQTVTTEQALAIWEELKPGFLLYVKEVEMDDDVATEEDSVIVETNGRTDEFYRCINTDYITMDSRIALIRDVFSKNYSALLENGYFHHEHARYLEKDGILYSKAVAVTGACIPSDEDAKLLAATDHSFVLELQRYIDGGLTAPAQFTFVLEDGVWKIDYILR